MKPTKEQLELIDKQVKRLVAGDSYYGKMYREAGITEIKSEEDFYKIPFTDKQDLRNAYPLGIQAVPDEEVVRIHSSSGTTGKPVIIPYTCLNAAIVLQASQKRTVSTSHPHTASGPQVSASRQAARDSARWLSPWAPAIQKSRFR